MCAECDREAGIYRGGMSERYLKCVSCGFQGGVGEVFSIINADCCLHPDIHVFKVDDAERAHSSVIEHQP